MTIDPGLIADTAALAFLGCAGLWAIVYGVREAR